MPGMDSEEFAQKFEAEIEDGLEDGLDYEKAVSARASQWAGAHYEEITDQFLLVTLPDLEREEASQLAASLYRAARAGFMEGLASISEVEEHRREDPYGLYEFDATRVRFNDNFTFEILRDWHERGDIAHNTVEWVVVHELGHHQHNMALDAEDVDERLVDNRIPDEHFDGYGGAENIRSLLQTVEEEVSDYARSNVGEFVAETFAGLCLGKEYSEQIMDLYREFHGPETYKEYREMFDPLPNEAEGRIEAQIDAVDLPPEVEASAEATAASVGDGPAAGDMGGVDAPGGIAAQLPPDATSAGGPHPAVAQRLARKLDEYGAERITVFTNDSTGVTTIDFETPLPGDAPQRASVTIRRDQIEEVTLRLGVLDPGRFDGHPTHDPQQIRRLVQTVRNLNPPGGSVVANYGDDRYEPRPHILLNWVPSQAEPREILTKEPFEPISVGEFMRFLRRATRAIREEYGGQFVDPTEAAAVYAKARPELVRPPEWKRDEIKLFYLQNSQQYARIWDDLYQTRLTYQRVPFQERKALLKASYMQAVMSVRVPWEKAEATFREFMEGKTIMEAWEDTNHGMFNKRGYMLETLAEEDVWETAVEQIDNGLHDAAHDTLLADAKYVGDAKAPFTLANLGLTQKMCIDGNLLNIFEAEQPEGLSVGEYEDVCAEVMQFFPELADMLQPYELQWVLFDYARIIREFDEPLDLPPGVDPTAAHDVWFSYVPGDTRYVKRRMDAATREAKEWAAEQD